MRERYSKVLNSSRERDEEIKKLSEKLEPFRSIESHLIVAEALRRADAPKGLAIVRKSEA